MSLIQTQLATELTQMHSGNMGIPRSTAGQTHGRATHVDGIRKGLLGTPGAPTIAGELQGSEH